MCCHLSRGNNSKARPPDCQRSFHARQKSASSAAPEEIPRGSSRRFGPNMVATFVGTCQPIPHFFLAIRLYRIELVERGTRRIVIGIGVRKTFGKVLRNFFSVMRFIPISRELFAWVSPGIRESRVGLFLFQRMVTLHSVFHVEPSLDSIGIQLEHRIELLVVVGSGSRTDQTTGEPKLHIPWGVTLA